MWDLDPDIVLGMCQTLSTNVGWNISPLKLETIVLFNESVSYLGLKLPFLMI